jgi:hypothetical protein
MIGSQWVLWQTGQPDFLSFEIALESAMLPALFGVIVLIILLSAWLLLKKR